MVAHNTQLEAVRQRIVAHRASELSRLAGHKDAALQQAEESVARARLQREQAVADATFREIFYTSNNMIYGFRRNGVPEPIFEADQQVLSAGERAVVKTFRDIRAVHAEARDAELTRLQGRRLERARLVEDIRAQEALASSMGSSPATQPLVHVHAALADQARRALMHLDTVIRGLESSVAVHQSLTQTFSESAQIRPAVDAAVADLALDTDANTLYFGRWAHPFQVSRCVLGDGNGADVARVPESLFMRPAPVSSLAVGDIDGVRHLLWIEGNKEIWAVPIGAEPASEDQVVKLHDITAPGRGGFFQLVVDPVNGFVFWSNTLSIWRARLSWDMSKTAAMVISPSESPHPIDLAVDGANDALYWIDRDRRVLSRSTLDGNQKEDLFPIAQPTTGLEVDGYAGFVYWTDDRDGAKFIRRGPTGQTALVFDGKSTYARIEDRGQQLTSYTIEIRFDPAETTGHSQALLGRYDREGRRRYEVAIEREGVVLLGADDDPLVVAPAGGGPQVLSISVTEQSRYCDVMVVNHNGERFDTRMPTMDSAAGPWILGATRTAEGLARHFAGALREVRIWDAPRGLAKLMNDRNRPLDVDAMPGLVGLWRSAERVGPIVPDLTNNGPAIELFSVGNEESRTEQVVSFGSDHHQLELPGLPFSTDVGFTVELWVRLTEQSDTTMWSMRDEDTGAAVSLSLGGEPFELRLVVNDGSVRDTIKSGVVPIGEWCHVAVTFSSSAKARLYVNGETRQRGGRTMPTNWQLNPDAIVVGGPQEFGSPLRGQISEIRIWDSAVPGRSLRKRRHLRIATDSPGLKGYWPLTEGQGANTKTAVGPVEPARLHSVDREHLVRFAQIDHVVAGLRAELTQRERELDHMRAQEANREREVLNRGPLVAVEVLTVAVEPDDEFRRHEAEAQAALEIEMAAEREAMGEDWADARNVREVADSGPRPVSTPPVDRAEELRGIIESMLAERETLRRRAADADMWTLERLPLATPERRERRVHEVLEISGCSGMAIHLEADYGAGLRAQAAARLTSATEEVNLDRQRARQSTELLKAASRRRQADEAAAGTRRIETARSSARSVVANGRIRQSDAQRAVTVNRARTIRTAADQVAKAQTEAETTTSNARTSSDAAVAGSRSKRDEAQSELRRAQGERSKL